MPTVFSTREPRASVVLNQFQREWLRGEYARTLADHAAEPDPKRRAFLVADTVWRRLTAAFARYAIDGRIQTAEFALPVLRVADRYWALCYLAYIGKRCPSRGYSKGRA